MGSTGPSDCPVRRYNGQDLQLGVTDVRFDELDQLRRDFAYSVFLGVLSRFLEDFLFRLTPYDVLTPTRRVYLGAFQDLCHGLTSLSNVTNTTIYYILVADWWAIALFSKH
jgi:hypothetical protein